MSKGAATEAWTGVHAFVVGSCRPRVDFRPRLSTVTLAAIACLGCQPDPPTQYEFSGRAMGTTYIVKLTPTEPVDDSNLEPLRAAIDKAIDNVDLAMSTYRPDSELSRFNAASAAEPPELSAATLSVFQAAAEIGRLTGGALDPTVGALVNAWGFGPGERRDLSDAEIDSLRAQTGWDKLAVGSHGVTKLADGVACDLSAIAKGYAVDRVSETLAGLGQTNHMVDIGGEIRTSGHNSEGRAWRIAIEKPETAGGIQRAVSLDNLSMATSGDYRNYYEKDGIRLSHTIDPRTGRPVAHHLASVAVIEPTCMRADGFATALMVLGEDEGYALAERLELTALFIVRTDEGFEERPTPAFTKRFLHPDR